MRSRNKAVDLLEPLDRTYPQHPGVPHYLIHAYDNAELAPKGLPAAKAYSQIAPSAPHALHMPSHIFTRLGLWEDSITSNLAAREAAHQQEDTGEELHRSGFCRHRQRPGLSVMDVYCMEKTQLYIFILIATCQRCSDQHH
jgi:hypothetical protein